MVDELVNLAVKSLRLEIEIMVDDYVKDRYLKENKVIITVIDKKYNYLNFW
ncbi:10529_t:CDS:2 [Entrophospora sp. SA101]|nr:10529_t:CDS:2 [Entrophospora sp. SA101]CAJ0843219.1 14582_t:CDS:2 [Entrophospora sp. SA101]